MAVSVEGGPLVILTQKGGRDMRALGLVEEALRAANLQREQVDCIAVGLGPGSYAGIRAAIALAQGWQLARGVRVLGISSAEAMAWRAHSRHVRGEGDVLINAQRGEFYRAHCAFLDEGPVMEPLQLIGPDEARSLRGSPIVAEQELVKLFPGALFTPPSAATLTQLASRREDFVSADKLEPIYLRATSFVKAPPPRVIRDGQAS